MGGMGVRAVEAAVANARAHAAAEDEDEQQYQSVGGVSETMLAASSRLEAAGLASSSSSR